MKLAFGAVFAVSCALAAVGCGSDDKASTSPKPTSADGGSGTDMPSGAAGDKSSPSGDSCHDGCVETLAAKCDNGPTDQASCESTCHSLETGKCGGEYATFQACAAGKPLTCSAQGLPIVAACSDQQTAFVSCLSQ